jgi:hypothetical protein
MQKQTCAIVVAAFRVCLRKSVRAIAYGKGILPLEGRIGESIPGAFISLSAERKIAGAAPCSSRKSQSTVCTERAWT